jgi:FtsP/CotA-like multicopper oxidase with cupredoxin domain
MSRNQRLALVAAAIAAAAVAFVIVNPGGSDNGGNGSSEAAQTTQAGTSSSGGATAAEQPQVERVEIAGNEVRGGPPTITVKKGDAVRIVVAVDKPNTIHLHGYDIEKQATPSRPARFAFTADLEGVFEIESHTFEDTGLEPSVAKLVVEPS